MRHRGSLGPAFASWSASVTDQVRPAFALALHGGVLTRLSRPLGPPDAFSGGCRPSQTAHLPVSPFSGLGTWPWVGGVPWTPPPPPEGWLRRLPPTLCTHGHAPTTGCSKAPRGLRFPLGVSGLCTGMVGSPGSGPGQWGPRYAIHAGRNLPDKEFRYLKRVIVTPAVYRRFARLYPGFTYRHWAGVGLGTHPYGLAKTCVFIKQSGPPGHCDLRSPHLEKTAGTPSPEVTGPICRLPWAGFPRHALGYSPRGTCVGSGYGHRGSLPAPFSRAPGLSRTLLTEGPSRFCPVLAITALPGLMRLATPTGVVGLPRSVRSWPCVAARTPVAREY